jgi:hypothetical protein
MHGAQEVRTSIGQRWREAQLTTPSGDRASGYHVLSLSESNSRRVAPRSRRQLELSTQTRIRALHREQLHLLVRYSRWYYY